MSSELAIVSGIAVIAFLAKEFAFRLSDHPSEWMQRLGVWLGFVSLFFINLVMYAVLNVAIQNAPYIVNGVVLVGVRIIMWTTMFIILAFALAMFWGAIQTFYEFAKSAGKRERD